MGVPGRDGLACLLLGQWEAAFRQRDAGLVLVAFEILRVFHNCLQETTLLYMCRVPTSTGLELAFLFHG